MAHVSRLGSTGHRELSSRRDKGLISTATMCEGPCARVSSTWPALDFRDYEAKCALFRPSCFAADLISASVAIGMAGVPPFA